MLLITDPSNDDRLDSSSRRLGEFIADPTDSISTEQMTAIFGDLNDYLVIPHYEKKPSIHSETLSKLAGHVTAGRGCYFGIGCSVRERIKLGDGVLVGMGAAVTSDVSSGLTVVGVPARPYSPPHDSVTQ